MSSTATMILGVAAGTCLECGWVNADLTGGTRKACDNCKADVKLSFVQGRHSDRHPCDPACQYAVGSYCVCACGGANHRAGYIDGGMVPVWVRDRDAKRHAERAARAASKADATRKRHAEQMAALLAEHPELEGLFDPRYDGADGFPADMRAACETGEMSPRQVDAAIRMIERDAARDKAQAEREAATAALIAAGVEVAEGKREIVGEIVRISSKESHFGYQSKTVWQITVKTDDGCKIMGTIPGTLCPTDYNGGTADDEGSWQWHLNQLIGKRVKLTGTVKRSDRDQTFGFYSRPGKASLIG
jgi:hypothetical protein